MILLKMILFLLLPHWWLKAKMVICKENSPCTRLQIKPTTGNTIFTKCSECCWDRKRKRPKEKTSGIRFERKSQTRQTAPSTAANYGVTRTLNNPNPTSGIYQSCLIFGEGKGERREKKQALLVLSAETLSPSTRIRVQIGIKESWQESTLTWEILVPFLHQQTVHRLSAHSSRTGTWVTPGWLKSSGRCKWCGRIGTCQGGICSQRNSIPGQWSQSALGGS